MSYVRKAGGYLESYGLSPADPIRITDDMIELAKRAARVVVFPVPWASTVIALDGGAGKLIARHRESRMVSEMVPVFGASVPA